MRTYNGTDENNSDPFWGDVIDMDDTTDGARQGRDPWNLDAR